MTDSRDSAPLVALTRVSRAFGERRALTDVSLSLAEGGRLALLGPNGAGKTTLLKIIGGALSKDSGEAKVFGLPPERARLVPKLLGWLPERAPLNPDLTVLEHLRLLARLIGLSKNETAAQIETLAEDLGLKAKLARLCGRLSLGSRRQAALGLALLGPPKLALLDEPTAGLDPEEVLRLRNFLEKLPKSVALIVSSHDLNETARSTIAAAILKDGVLLKPRPWADLGPDPKEGYVMALRQNASL